MPRVVDKEAKKMDILHAAMHVFAKKGVVKTKMIDIATIAGVGKGTIYEYFRSKEDLMVGIPHEKLNRLYESVSGNSVEAKMRNLISRLFNFYADEKDYATVLVLMLRTNKKFHHSKSNKIIDRLFKIIEAVIRKGQEQNIFVKDLDLGICRNFLFGTLDHVMIPWIIFGRSYDLRLLGSEVSDLFIKAIRA